MDEIKKLERKSFELFESLSNHLDDEDIATLNEIIGLERLIGTLEGKAADRCGTCRNVRGDYAEGMCDDCHFKWASENIPF